MTPTVRRLRVLAVTVACVAAAVAPGVDAGAAGAAPRQDPPVWRIESVSPWVEHDGEFEVRFAPSSTVPADATITVTIHQALDGGLAEARETLVDQVRGGGLGPPLQEPLSLPVGFLGDPGAGAVMTVPLRSGSGDPDRVLVPNPGVHPVEVVVTSPEGDQLARDVVYLNRLPEDDGDTSTGDPVDVSLLLPVESDPAVASDGGAAFDVEEESSLGAIASLLAEVPDAPLMLGVRPNTLDGLARAGRPWASDLLARLTADDRAAVLQMPYAAVDSGALVASGHGAELVRQVLVGASTTTEQLGRSPDPTTWALDDSVTTEALPLLGELGVRSLLVPGTALDLDGEDLVAATTAPRPLSGSPTIRALAYDSAASQLLADPGTEPAQRVQQALSLLLVGWFDRAADGGDTDLASAVRLDPNVEPAVVAALGTALEGDGPLRAAVTGPVPPEDGAGTADTVALARRSTPPVGPAVEATDRTRAQIDSYRSMVGDADPDLPLWVQLTDQSLAASLDDGARTAMHFAVLGAIEARVGSVVAPPERNVVITSESAAIPLRFRNDLPWPVELRMSARSPRLDLGGSAVTQVVLAPGENRVDLPVEVRAPGESLLRIELSSPDGLIELPGADVPVRSTAISGVGAALSVLSLLVLVAWWARTHRRRRRGDARDGGRHPSSEADDAGGATERVHAGG